MSDMTRAAIFTKARLRWTKVNLALTVASLVLLFVDARLGFLAMSCANIVACWLLVSMYKRLLP